MVSVLEQIQIGRVGHCFVAEIVYVTMASAVTESSSCHSQQPGYGTIKLPMGAAEAVNGNLSKLFPGMVQRQKSTCGFLLQSTVLSSAHSTYQRGKEALV
jgi:hypothetical protein